MNAELKKLLAAHLGIEGGDPDSWPLVECALETLRQVTRGKGRERHQRGRDFVDQPILVIPALLGGEVGLGGLLYQAMKKCEESVKMPTDRRVAELRGAVIYTLAAIMHEGRQPTIESAQPVEFGHGRDKSVIVVNDVVRLIECHDRPQSIVGLLGRVVGVSNEIAKIRMLNGEARDKEYLAPTATLEIA